MKNPVVAFCLCLLFFSCDKDVPKKDDPAPTAVKYYPTEVVRTNSASPDITTTRYTYNANQQVYREENLQNNQLSSYTLYYYTPEGHLLKKSKFRPDDQQEEQDEFELNGSGKATRLNHSYIVGSGAPALHHYSNYRYTSAGKLSEITEFTPAGQPTKKLIFEQVNNHTGRVLAYNSNNSLDLTSESHYDLKNHPFSATVLNTGNFQGNVVYYTLNNESNQITTTFTSAIIYKDDYPQKITQTYSGGLVVTETYTYTLR